MSRRRRRQVVEELAAFVLFQLWHKKLASYESGAGGTALGWLTMVVRSQVAQFWREHKPPRDLLLVSLPEWDLCEDRVDYALYEDIDTLGSQPPSESDTEPIAEVEELSLGDLTENLLGQVHLLATPKQRDALDRYYQDDWWSDADRQAKARLSRRVRQDASLRQEHRRVLTAVERSALPALRLYVQRKRWVNARVPARRGETMAAKGLPYAGPVVRSCLWCRQVLPSDSDDVYRAEEEDRCLLSWPPANRSPAGGFPAASDGGQALCPGPLHRPRGV